MHGWTIRDSEELYGVRNWGAGFFSINDKGHVEVTTHAPTSGPGIDLLELVQDLEQRGLRTPLLIRFSDILADARRSSSAARSSRPSPSTTTRAATAASTRSR